MYTKLLFLLPIAGAASSSTAGGLTNAVLYAEGSKVMITANLWKDAGIVIILQ